MALFRLFPAVAILLAACGSQPIGINGKTADQSSTVAPSIAAARHRVSCSARNGDAECDAARRPELATG